MARVLIVCADGRLRNDCGNTVVSNGHSCAELTCIEQALQFGSAEFDVIIAEEALYQDLLDKNPSWESKMVVLASDESRMYTGRFRTVTAIFEPFPASLPIAVASVIAVTLSTLSE
ncbi:MAG: hypothetical protein WC289_01275 [Patescibacteria group bacterium]|jgi:hypothetical protein